MDQELAPEVCIDLSSEDMATDQTCQDSCKTTRGKKEFHEKGTTKGMATYKASQVGRKKSRDCNEESNPMVPQPSEMQGDSNPAEPPSDCNEERNPMAPEESETQGNSDLAEPPPVEPTPVVDENYRQLFEATLKGDWKAIKRILNEDPEAVTANLMTSVDGDDNVLEIANLTGQDELVEKLLKRIPPERKADGLANAFVFFARKGRIKRVKESIDKLEKDEGGSLALSALLITTRSTPKQKEVIWYLAKRITSPPSDDIVMNLIKAGHLDILLDLAHRYDLATSVDTKNGGLLEVFAHVKSYYRSGAKLNFWEKCIYQCVPCSVDTSFDNTKDTKMARATHWFKRSLWNVATKLAPFIKRIGELKVSHECSLELAKLTFNKRKACMKAPEILKLTSTIALDAASSGISEIVRLCLEHSPELMWNKEFTKELMREIVKGRHVELFRVMNAFDPIPKLRYDIERNCDLMAAVVEWSPGYVPADVSGAAFLMQRELQWFEVLEDKTSPFIRSLKFKVKEDKSSPSKSLELKETKERSGKTYWGVFVEQRKDLVKEAGQWMKETSSSCSVISTLIFTVAFAAAFTVPGSDDRGNPVSLRGDSSDSSVSLNSSVSLRGDSFLVFTVANALSLFSSVTEDSFLVFTVANALSLFSSVTATSMFLAILTSCYAAEDFLHSLPRKMILGLTFLFLSFVFILVAFGSALVIVLRERWKWIHIPITLLVVIPAILSALLQLPLYVEMVESTYWPRLFRPVKIWK